MLKMKLRQIISTHLSLDLVSYEHSLNVIETLSLKQARAQLSDKDQALINELKAEGLFD